MKMLLINLIYNIIDNILWDLQLQIKWFKTNFQVVSLKIIL